jgi:hypothetical protein
MFEKLNLAELASVMSTQVYSRESLSSFGTGLGMTDVSFRIDRVTWSAGDNKHVGLCTELNFYLGAGEAVFFGQFDFVVHR